MSGSMRWLLDEGTPKALVEWLARAGDDVLDVAVSDLRGSSDERLWRIAGRQGRIVMTRDLGFMLPQVTPYPAGVVLVRAPDTYGADAIMKLVEDALGTVPRESLPGAVTVIEPGKVRQRRLAGLPRRTSRRRD